MNHQDHRKTTNNVSATTLGTQRHRAGMSPYDTNHSGFSAKHPSSQQVGPTNDDELSIMQTMLQQQHHCMQTSTTKFYVRTGKIGRAINLKINSYQLLKLNSATMPRGSSTATRFLRIGIPQRGNIGSSQLWDISQIW
eukprot:2107289-Amphidinium_carterae.1